MTIFFVKPSPFVLHEMQVVADEHDAVSSRDTGDGDEADEGGDADVVQLEVGEDEAADEGERDVAEHLEGEERRAEVAVEQEGDDGQDDEREDGDALRGLLLRLELALEGDEVAFGHLHFRGHFIPHAGDEVGHVLHGGLDGEGEAALRVFAEDDVRPFGLAHVGDEGKRDALAFTGLDGQLGDLVRRIAPLDGQAGDEASRRRWPSRSSATSLPPIKAESCSLSLPGAMP
jgi:hypothetical protein